MKRFLRITGIAIGGLLLLVVAAVALVARGSQTSVYVADGSVIETELRLRPLDLQNYKPWEERDQDCARILKGNHTVVRGSHTVLTRNYWNPGRLGVIDDEWYEDLTIELEDPPFDVSIKMPSPKIRIYYSKGGSAWVEQCAGVFATSATGHITLKRSWFGRIRAQVDLAIQPKDPRGWHDPGTIRILGTFSFKRVNDPVPRTASAN